jgi:hypothetical protein
MRKLWLIAALLLVGIALSGCSGKGDGTPPAQGSSQPPPRGGPAAAPPAWSMELDRLPYPDRPAAGQVHGQNFVPDQVKLENGVLTFQQGRDFFSDRQITVFLFREAEAPAKGMKLEIRPDAEPVGLTPHVHLGWREGGAGPPQSEVFTGKYALKLEIGILSGSKLPGKIYLCLPDQHHSFLSGTFSVDVPELVGARIRGRLEVKKPGNYKLAVGYVGCTVDGQVKAGMAGAPVSVGQDNGSISSSGTRLAFDKREGCTFQHIGLQPGTYLVFATWDEQYLDWKWVEVAEQKDLTVDLAVDPDRVGTLEVRLPPGSKDRTARLLPLDAGGKLPAMKASPESLAFQLQTFVNGMAAEAKAGENIARFSRLKAGRYRVLAGKAAADVVIKAGETAKVELPATP